MKKFIFQFKYTALMLLKEKQLLFWMIFFPILICSAFYMAFSNLDNPIDMTIKLGIVSDSTAKSVLSKVPIFQLVEYDREKLSAKLLNEDIDAYLDENYELVVPDSSVKSNVAVGVIESIEKYSIAYMIRYDNEHAISSDSSKYTTMSSKELFERLPRYERDFNMASLLMLINKKIEYKNQESSTLKTVLFTAFAMFSLNVIYMSASLMEIVQGYLSHLAIRISASSYKKRDMILAVFSVCIVFNIVYNVVLYGFVKFILGVTLFTQFGISLLILLVSSVFGVSIGILFGTVKSINIDQKSGVTTAVILLFSFLCGMNGQGQVRLNIEEKLPLLNRINFVNLINESFYQANLIGDWSKIPRNLTILVIASLVILVISGFVLRRKTYDSL